MIRRLFWFLPLLVFSCVLAAVYGAVHNQISYSVAPEYFHAFKFLQFRMDPVLQNRLGASLVGVLASWWMGIILGVPIYLVGLFVKGHKDFVRSYLWASLMVVGVTLAVGLGALIVAYAKIDAQNLPTWMSWQPAVSDPVAFARAGMMHNFSYLGGLLGAVVGLIYMILIAWRSRTKPDL